PASVRWKPDSKPHCGRKKKLTRRRSPTRKGRNRICKQLNKAKFNNNLINIFCTEWSRKNGGVVRPYNNETDFQVNQWKFCSMDVNSDDVLDKNEYRDPKRVAKKAVKPKNRSRPNVLLGTAWTNASEDNANEQEDYADSFLSHRPLPHALIGQSYDDESSEIHNEEPPDYLSDRQAALLDGGQFYVPECTPNGRYKKIQCYKAAGYCFCVHEDTGKNIPGTSVKHGIPKCDQLTNVNRSMKGCPNDKKTVFLKDLVQFLHVRMLKNNDMKNLNTLSWMSSKEEQAATWSFVDFDKNKNKIG
ncbi:Thyroglobulin 1 and/or DUF2981 domain containing protein, partial [Asbolus verrucosus]